MYCYVDIFYVDVGVLVLLFVLCSFVVDEYHVSLRCIARLVAGCSCGMLSRMYKHANRCYMTDNTDYRKIYQTNFILTFSTADLRQILKDHSTYLLKRSASMD
ncbi:unnamed protein product [Spodoptera littoralis]|uniref:Uncharacterized protein n=1 Tax=Spodoptera littoralis TaxID=7109 RepID=A0A9P0IB99_SPOLI|nr:unnamed protein product [Spodoptera littoralis]CAH1643662.1 unnamed protein product [Spodoptera littoralis]